MTLGSETVVVNGQRFTTPTGSQYRPAAYGQQTTGVPQISPSMPPMMGATSSGGSPGVYEGVNGYGTAGNNGLVAALAAENPHSLKLSPVWWAVITLLTGLWLLNVVHWRSLEEGKGSLSVGPAHAEGSEGI